MSDSSPAAADAFARDEDRQTPAGPEASQACSPIHAEGCPAVQAEEARLAMLKRPVGGAFQMYVADWRRSKGYAGEVQGLEGKGIVKLASSKFKALAEQERRPFQDQFDASMSTWRATRAVRQCPRRARAEPFAAMPKKPVGGAFQIYVAHWRLSEGYAGEVQGLQASDIGKLASAKFKALTDEEKKPFQVQFDAAMSAWKAARLRVKDAAGAGASTDAPAAPLAASEPPVEPPRPLADNYAVFVGAGGLGLGVNHPFIDRFGKIGKTADLRKYPCYKPAGTEVVLFATGARVGADAAWEAAFRARFLRCEPVERGRLDEEGHRRAHRCSPTEVDAYLRLPDKTAYPAGEVAYLWHFADIEPVAANKAGRQFRLQRRGEQKWIHWTPAQMLREDGLPAYL